jgi:hypothetical protein
MFLGGMMVKVISTIILAGQRRDVELFHLDYKRNNSYYLPIFSLLSYL